MLEIRPTDRPDARVSYAYANANPRAILAPEAPGSYRIVYVFEREVRASLPLTVFLPEASLEAPASVGAGADFEVTWRGPDSRQDRIVIAERNGPPIRGAAYSYVGNTRGGPARLRAHMDDGEYDVAYLTGSTILARAPVRVAAVSATLRHPPSVHAGGELRVIWDGPRNAQDRVTFAETGGAPLGGASYAYVANTDDSVVVLRAPVETGPVDVVYFSGGRVIGRSSVAVVNARIDLDGPAEVTALEAFPVTWQGNGNSGDRVVIEDEESATLAYSYIRPGEPQVRLGAPAIAGDFQLVYRARDGREMARQPVRVLPAAQPPGTLVVAQARPALSPDDAVGVILDASGSMLQRLDGVRRIDIARDTLSGLVSDTVPAGTGFALRVFGHREPGSCRSDLEIPLSPLNPSAARNTIAGIDAMNLARTPLGRSIALAAQDLADATGRRRLVVLTDGEETCDGDAVASIGMLRANGWDLTVNIVGFAIDDAALEAEFAAWADLGGGAYFRAIDRDSLHYALLQAVAVRFTVLDGQGEAVADGRPGDILSLPAGEYVIAWGNDRRTPVGVSAGRATRVVLDQSPADD